MTITHQKQTVIQKNMFTLVLMLFISFVNSDLPIHCVRSDIEGTWEFFLDSKSFAPSIKDEQTTCGHGFPNRVQYKTDNSDDDLNKIVTPHTKIILEIASNYKVYENSKEVGNWTPIFDQSFLIYYKNSVFTSPFQYYLKNENSGEFTSDCGKSLVGWVVSDKNNKKAGWRCFYAKKINQKMNFLQTKKNTFSFVQFKQSVGNPLLYKVKYEELGTMVDEINNANLTWKAEVNPEFKGLSLNEVNKKLGLNKGITRIYSERYQQKMQEEAKQNPKKKNNQHSISAVQNNSYDQFIRQLNAETPKKINNTPQKPTSFIQKTLNIDGTHKNIKNGKKHDKDSKFVFNKDEMTKYINTKLEDIDEETLPLNWDWRNVGGDNYVPEVVEQGNCGSCYVFSSIFSLESRLRIKTHNEDKTRFSVQFPLSCNFYSEGCDGGYPILVGKFLSEFEIVPRDCFEYHENDDSCSSVCDYEQFPRKYVVSDYGYLGGYYGGTNEVLMMKEIRARGPIPGNIKVPVEFNYYRQGIFSTSGLTKNADKLNKVSIVDKHITFEKVEHSITLVGYGEEDGVKYWIGMNTWGKKWGENGFFKILRGENEQNIETMGDYLNIDILDRKTGKKLY